MKNSTLFEHVFTISLLFKRKSKTYSCLTFYVRYEKMTIAIVTFWLHLNLVENNFISKISSVIKHD